MKTDIIRNLIACAAVALAIGGVRADEWTDPDTGYTWSYYEEENGIILGGGGFVGGGCSFCGIDGSSKSVSVLPEPKGALVIPDAINGKPVIGLKETFVGFKQMTNVIFPDSIKIIGDRAFAFCSGLTSIVVPSGVMRIGDEAFMYCKGLTSVTIPNSVSSIGYLAFESCNGLKSLVIPEGVSRIEESAFWMCEGLTSLTINGDTAIEAYAFEDNSSLSSVTFLGDSVADSYYYVFLSCKKLANVYANKDLEGILNETSVRSSKCKFTYGTAVRACVADGQEGMGTVSGFGVYQPGQKVTLKAVPNKGHVFTGWYNWTKDEYVDSRNASYLYIVTEDNVDFDATFATEQEDVESLYVYVDDDETEADGTYMLDIGACVESLSVPKVSVLGLPSGLKFDAKTGLITGKATKPGVYVVTVGVTNASQKNPVTETFRIVVPNLRCDALPNLKTETDYYNFEAGMTFVPDSVNCAAADKDWKVAAAGSPTGLKFDAKTGNITGVATKPGIYTVTFTATKGKEKQVATITLNIAALPDNVVGAFNGFVKTDDGEENLGTFQLTTTDAGKLTAKVTTSAGSYSFSGTCWDSVNDDGVYSAKLETKKGEKLTLALDSTAGWDKNQLTGTFSVGGVSRAVVARKNAFGKTWYFNAVGNETDGWALSYAENAKTAALTVTLNADGSTKIAGKLGYLNASGKTESISVSASGYADVTSLSEGVILADFAPVVSVKEGKATLKRVLSIGTNLWFDRSNDHAEGIGSTRIVE